MMVLATAKGERRFGRVHRQTNKGGEIMGEKVKLALVGLALIASLGACAKEYGIPPGGPHFASFTHMGYSLKGEKPKLTKAEASTAKAEGWWGTPVRYTVDDLE